MIGRLLAICALMGMACIVASCASDTAPATTGQTASSVPGEKVSGDNQIVPNATNGGPSASIGW